MAIRAFNSLNKRQQLGILIGAPSAVALFLIVLIYRALGVLGPDPTDRLPGFFHRNIPDNLWGQIIDTEQKIAVEQAEIDKRAAVQKEMDGLEADVKAALERLPRESEKIDMRQADREACPRHPERHRRGPGALGAHHRGRRRHRLAHQQRR